MAYNTIKQCKCGKHFKANSNKQINCLECRPIARKELMKKANSKHYKKTREIKLEYSTKYNNSEKGKASNKLRMAVRSGKIQRQPCEICNKPNADGHHDDYSKPLEVRWLCKQHHAQIHLYKPWQIELINAGYKDGFLLGELIEACKGRIIKLWILADGRAGVQIEGESLTDVEYYPFADEAVANLYLAIHKK